MSVGHDGWTLGAGQPIGQEERIDDSHAELIQTQDGMVYLHDPDNEDAWLQTDYSVQIGGENE